ncbi:conjugal transfer protein [Verminephrobacter aporrectodeae subsp. tuberculatae]|uniref:Conjugal transfer protein n=1 Tax=Verminephrobacter aporrectodeae subsp. tuberculatae TaxID=1110392 RepID=A0ABT3KQT0_9BURK|nr:VirB8/TrbF family protein [Verminephrobacter aporrectodeae]MCW5320682.1 conjugal transfer protein [Verminephrobacter aporrectodeae subsp. tuberculatae]MCW8200285.1 conjugal transfer protein [Verminephrobacter aporrectodeae subsp. tuberculatae]
MPEKRTPLETPYLAARREWNERYGNFIATANNWRLAALGSIAVAIIAVSGLVWVSGQHKVVPYAVEFNGNGEVERVARADVASQPNNRQMVAALRNWVIGARTVYVDGRAEKAIVDQTYAMTYPDSACYQTLSTYHQENNPYVRAQKETVEVTVNAVVPVSDSTWQVDWTEITKQRSGKVIDTKQYQGSITTVIAPPTSDAQIMVNPLGIYAQQCAWTTRL